ncbi:hypothetical protein CLAFUW4_11506 [Fulvia fulva]|uniref:Uncharacterized protein n=1 Tax=Passalora fulva TaxID=5499 RepID=A0A9Q8URQ8_PASFU|nr:uncharacterized protein CLAFUR5_10549 [Fulvia fulva]KAK4620058.1 hypothetical protein CLAFUR4_11512 [Fulvia fulva]KAK4620260.1 hypothetical protein CLAFUR0_11520 [Fulvia fulva]UJO19976.1 hypothetical protein CLAFUR5_10549 [Fulvia fulva]WPV17588.1 hypothetical protein CLAFUW4_11506 [Fulvia fulva]WPV32176.1 hypothetical protein CLAFUW7_11511 [Fulvia fulva]
MDFNYYSLRVLKHMFPNLDKLRGEQPFADDKSRDLAIALSLEVCRAVIGGGVEETVTFDRAVQNIVNTAFTIDQGKISSDDNHSHHTAMNHPEHIGQWRNAEVLTKQLDMMKAFHKRTGEPIGESFMEKQIQTAAERRRARDSSTVQLEEPDDITQISHEEIKLATAELRSNPDQGQANVASHEKNIDRSRKQNFMPRATLQHIC